MRSQIKNIIACMAVISVLAGCAHKADTATRQGRSVGAISLMLPEPAHTTNTEPQVDGQDVLINIARDVSLSVAGEPCQQSELPARLTKLAANPKPAVVIRADANVPFKHCVAVMDACKAAGLQNLRLFPAN